LACAWAYTWACTWESWQSASKIANITISGFKKSLDESLLHGPPEADDQSFPDCQQLSFGSFRKAM
jgi:hypothetical protein